MVWQDPIFFNETVYPASYFAAELLNVPKETMRELVTHGSAISHQVESLALAGWSEFINLLDETRISLEKLLDAVRRFDSSMGTKLLTYATSAIETVSGFPSRS